MIFQNLKSLIHFSTRTQLLYGINPIEVALNSEKRKLQTLYVSDSQAIEMGSRLTKIILTAKKKQIPIVFNSKQRLSRLVKNQPHQNIVLKCSELELMPVKRAKDFEDGIYVFCDKITDPQNFGAIARSCLYFGIKGIFTNKKNSAPLNTTVSKASSGALELMDIYNVGKQQEYLQEWKEDSGIIISTSVNQHTSKPLNYQDVSAKGENRKTMVLVGSESTGVSAHLAKHANYSLTIERMGKSEYPYSLVDSLNVNAALTCILFELTKK